MNFKLDENLGRSVSAAFEAEDHDVSSVHLQKMEGVNDRKVFEFSWTSDANVELYGLYADVS